MADIPESELAQLMDQAILYLHKEGRRKETATKAWEAKEPPEASGSSQEYASGRSPSPTPISVKPTTKDNFVTQGEFLKLVTAIAQQGAKPGHTTRSMRLRDVQLHHSEQFNGKNASAFISRLEDRWDIVPVVTSIQKCQTFVINISIDLVDEVKALDGYETRDWDELKVSFLKEYADSDERRIKGTHAYLERLAREADKGTIAPKNYVKEFRTHWKTLHKNGETTCWGSQTFLAGLQHEVQLKIILTLKIEPSVVSTLSDINAIMTLTSKIIRLDNSSKVLGRRRPFDPENCPER